MKINVTATIRLQSKNERDKNAAAGIQCPKYYLLISNFSLKIRSTIIIKFVPTELKILRTVKIDVPPEINRELMWPLNKATIIIPKKGSPDIQPFSSKL